MWDATPSITFDPERVVHYAYFYEHFARARLNAGNVFLHGLRFAVFPSLEEEVSVRNAQVTLGAARVTTKSEGELVAFAKPFMTTAQFDWLLAALEVLRKQGDFLWA